MACEFMSRRVAVPQFAALAEVEIVAASAFEALRADNRTFSATVAVVTPEEMYVFLWQVNKFHNLYHILPEDSDGSEQKLSQERAPPGLEHAAVVIAQLVLYHRLQIDIHNCSWAVVWRSKMWTFF